MAAGAEAGETFRNASRLNVWMRGPERQRERRHGECERGHRNTLRNPREG